MKQILREEWRKGGFRPCPKCHAEIKYAVFNIHTRPTAYFYSTSGKAMLLRRADGKRFGEILQQVGEDEEKLRDFGVGLLEEAPLAPDGTRFDLWANLRCPHCGYEFPYNNGVHSIVRRILDTKIVLVDGTIVIGDTQDESYVIRVD